MPGSSVICSTADTLPWLHSSPVCVVLMKENEDHNNEILDLRGTCYSQTAQEKLPKVLQTSAAPA